MGNRTFTMPIATKCVCKICSKEFLAKRSDTKYCSKECKKYRYNKTCEVCGKEFNSAKAETRTCSHDCRWTLNRNKTVRLQCGKDFERPTFTVFSENVFCSQHCNNVYNVEKNYGTTNRYGQEWHSVKNIINFSYDYTCQKCFAKGVKLNVHHCVPFRYFSSHEEANNLENLIPLCVGCHKETHNQHNEWYKQTFGGKKI